VQRIDLAAHRNPFVDGGYMAWKVSAMVRESLAVLEPATEFQDSAVEFAQQRSDAAFFGKSMVTSQPAIWKLSGAWFPGPNTLNT